MADICKIQTESGTYDIKDLVIREKSTFTFNNVNEMKTSTLLKEDYYCKTLGYYNINDDGSAYYYVRKLNQNETPDDASVILLNDETLVAELISSDKINVKQFGCYGDNIHDDTSNFQKAVNYCETNKYSLYIPTGHYKITSAIEVTGCNIYGNGKNTWIYLSQSDGFHLHPYMEQTVCEFKGVSFYSNIPTTWIELCGIDIMQSVDSNRSRGYLIHECYFENLGCAIEINDAFRTTVQNININNCFRALYIKNQTVQCYFNNIISNYDLSSGLSSERYGDTSIGIQIGYPGFTHRCEGIKIESCCMTNHEVGFYQYDCLFSNVIGCEFDLCRKEGVIVFSWEGTCNIKDNWIVSQSYSAEPIIDIQTSSTTVKYKLNVESNLVGNINGNENKIGIAVGRISDYYFRSNVSILNNTIKNFTGSTPLKYGIYVNRGKQCSIIGNYSNNCSSADIYFIPDGNGMMNNNIATIIDVTVFANDTLYAYSNIVTTVNKSIAGTLVGDL